MPSMSLDSRPKLKGCGGVFGGTSTAGLSGALTSTTPVSSMSGALDDDGDMRPVGSYDCRQKRISSLRLRVVTGRALAKS